MAKTAIQLVRELGDRLFEHVLLDITGAGTTTTLVAPNLVQYYPDDVSADLHAWVYGPVTVTQVSNRGVERRARAWTASTTTLTFHAALPWPAALSDAGDDYDFHQKYPHSRLLAAINEGVGDLGIVCQRPVIDTSLTILENTWTYTLPSSVNWATVDKIQIQGNTDAGLTGYPYREAEVYGYNILHQISGAGSESWVIQFRSKPPVNRLIKVFGTAYYPSLSADSDTLAIAGKMEAAAQHWVLDYALYVLNDWTAQGVPQTEVASFRQKWFDKLQERKERLEEYLEPHGNSRIVTPLNDGTLRPGVRRGYFGAYTPH